MLDQTSKQKICFSLLWVAVMLNMVFADVLSIVVELVKEGAIEVPLEVTTMMALAAVLTNIPILMVALSWVMRHRLNRVVQIAAAIFTILYVVGGGANLPHYLIIGGVEVLLLTIIIVQAVRWRVN
jgi:hypothetical protein